MGMKDGIETLSTTARVATLGLWSFIGVSALLAMVQVAMFAAIPRMETAMLLGIVAAGLGILQFITFLLCVVVIALWVNQAHKNLHEAGLDELNYAPGWAAMSFFIPFINLWVPFVSTRELYNRSHGESAWHAAIPAGDVTSWYACNWGAFAVFIAVMGYVMVDAIPGVFVLLPVWASGLLVVLLYVLVLGSAWFFLQVIRKVTAAQEAGMHVGHSDVFA